MSFKNSINPKKRGRSCQLVFIFYLLLTPPFCTLYSNDPLCETCLNNPSLAEYNPSINPNAPTVATRPQWPERLKNEPAVKAAKEHDSTKDKRPNREETASGWNWWQRFFNK